MKRARTATATEAIDSSSPVQRRTPTRYHDLDPVSSSPFTFVPDFVNGASSSDEADGSVSCAGGSCMGDADSTHHHNGHDQDQKQDDVDKTIVKELNELSLKDREKMFEEIHGVLDEVEPDLAETDAIEELFVEMQAAVDSIKKKPAYDQARFLRPSYVRDRELLIMMLRADNYDTNKAALRLVRYFEMKIDLFGLDCLVKDLTQDDLTESMKEQLRKGYIQMPVGCDRAGRGVIFVRDDRDSTPDYDGYCGMNWYLTMRALRGNADAQKFGFVVVSTTASTRSSMIDPSVISLIRRSVQMNNALPAKCAAFHWCYDNPKLKTIISAYQAASLPSVRLRLRPHFGTPMEYLYALMSYGVTPDMLPIDADGNVDLSRWHARLEKMREEEQRIVQEDSAIVPTSKDCLFGRGWPYQRFEGNVFLASLVERNREARNQVPSRKRKTNMVRGIIQYMEQVRGTRFLKRGEDGETWEKVSSEDEIVKKISHAFRAPRKSDQETIDDISDEFESDSGEIILIPPKSNK